MSGHVRVPIREPIAGFAVHKPGTAADVAPEGSSRAVELLSLGQAEVREAAEHAELMACLQQVQNVLSSTPDLVRSNLQEVVALATEIGLAVAREVVGEALDSGSVDPTPVVQRCLEDATLGLSEGASVTVRLHPEDLPVVVQQLDSDLMRQQELQQVQLLADPSLQRAEVRIETAAGRLLYDHREVLERISTEVRAAMASPAEPAPPADPASAVDATPAVEVVPTEEVVLPQDPPPEPAPD